VRLTGGKYRGRVIRVPKGARPTGSRVREALFSIWCRSLLDARFLDLYAGSGGVGLEALSRGARRVHFVDRGGSGIGTLERNCESLQANGWTVQAVRLPEDLSKVPNAGSWDLVFADPPYAFSEYEELLNGVARLLSAEGRLAIEHSSRTTLPADGVSIAFLERREYGESALTFYRR
jgi:16S rRNA (guanine966-N2)-methyltransferase